MRSLASLLPLLLLLQQQQQQWQPLRLLSVSPLLRTPTRLCSLLRKNVPSRCFVASCDRAARSHNQRQYGKREQQTNRDVNVAVADSICYSHPPKFAAAQTGITLPPLTAHFQDTNGYIVRVVVAAAAASTGLQPLSM